MRLFTVLNIRASKRSTVSFVDKQEAKVYRDELNGGLSTEEDKKWNTDKGWRVTYGPDHWRYTS